MQVNFAYVADGGNPLLIHFTDQTSQNPTVWAWDFGDGSTSTSQSPSHTYTTGNQSYYVTLTATNALGTAFTTILVPVSPTISASISSAPVMASFTVDNLFVQTGNTITFTDTSTNHPIHWSWTDNGNGFSTSQAPGPQTFALGTHVIVLTASNGFGWGTSATATIVVGSDATASNHAVGVEISATPRFGAQPLSVAFTSTLSTTGSYSWTTSDGQTSTLANPTFIFKQPGKYTITLTATNTYGSTTASIIVYIPDLVFRGDDYFYVLDKPNDRVLVFDYSGNYIGYFGSQGSGLGQLLNPTRLTVNHKTF
jgi:PKD repeat protein